MKGLGKGLDQGLKGSEIEIAEKTIEILKRLGLFVKRLRKGSDKGLKGSEIENAQTYSYSLKGSDYL